jgi:hypothetical protein
MLHAYRGSFRRVAARPDCLTRRSCVW